MPFVRPNQEKKMDRETRECRNCGKVGQVAEDQTDDIDDDELALDSLGLVALSYYVCGECFAAAQDEE